MIFYYKTENGLLSSSIPLEYDELTKEKYNHLLEIQTLLKEISLDELSHFNLLF